MRRVRRGLVLLGCGVLGFASAACWKETGRDAAGSDRRAIVIADQVIAALGGQRKWDALPGLRWSFGSSVNDSVRSERRHAWNKLTGQHRVDGINRQGQHYTLMHTVGDTTTGMAWMDGTRIEGDSLHKLLRRADALWTNDTYWMLMPYKLRDPGVTLRYAGDTTLAGTACDRLALTFQQVGLTPGDCYWVYVSRPDRRVVRWDMVLEGDTPPPVSSTWEGWEEHDGLWFPTAHRRDSINTFTNRIETVRGFAPTEFSQP